MAEAYGIEPRYIGVRYRAPLHRGSYVWACLMEEPTTRIESNLYRLPTVGAGVNAFYPPTRFGLFVLVPVGRFDSIRFGPGGDNLV